MWIASVTARIQYKATKDFPIVIRSILMNHCLISEQAYDQIGGISHKTPIVAKRGETGAGDSYAKCLGLILVW